MSRRDEPTGHEAWLRFELSRRHLFKYVLGAAALVAAACTGGSDRNGAAAGTDPGTQAPPEPTEPPGPLTLTLPNGQLFEAVEGMTLPLTWTAATGADAYDVEINGVIAARDLATPQLDVGFGHARTGVQEGSNSYRVRARNSVGETWSDAGSYEVVTVGGIRARHFDQEDDGDVSLTVESAGAALTVGSRYAFGRGGKGVSLSCTDPIDTRAYKNHLMLPTEECWVRLAVRPEAWGKSPVNVSIARIRAADARATEYLYWTTGIGLGSTSIVESFPLPSGEWSQAQLGVKADGTVELWMFDGYREFLVGRGLNEDLVGQAKDVVSIGNNSPNSGITYEVWLDEFAVAEQRMPWARVDDEHELRRPRALEPDALPPTFSFVFGSCNVSTRVPYVGTALDAASRLDADFVIHLGDYGYPDTGAPAQSKQGYIALWTDILFDERMNRLFARPWVYVASDHDVGGNNVDAESLSPFALDAYTSWHSNDRSVEQDGRYGAVEFDEGRVLLLWVDSISVRSPLSQRDGSSKTCLGNEQKEWFLNMLATSTASLIIIASQAPVGHQSNSGWTRYATERREVLDACADASGVVRWITGDHHSARWARLRDDVAEWGAAPFAEVAQVCSIPALDTQEAHCVSRPALSTTDDELPRKEILTLLDRDQLDSYTSFGRVEIDTTSHRAMFDVRDSAGQVRTDSLGFRMSETIVYG